MYSQQVKAAVSVLTSVATASELQPIALPADDAAREVLGAVRRHPATRAPDPVAEGAIDLGAQRFEQRSSRRSRVRMTFFEAIENLYT